MSVIGIDLGTTNCAVAWAEANEDKVTFEDFPVLQLTHPGTCEPRNTLPSFVYIPGPHEMPKGSAALPWDPEATKVTGWLAREQGAKVPHRVVSSAKSWLSQDGVDRYAPILPWEAPDEVERISPLEASAMYLKHIRDAWNASHPDMPFEEQEVVLTVPASFDTIARELTAEAASMASINNLTLLEEPQAAFYSWLEDNQEDWREKVSPGDKILVCDIGGGTTDFSLILVSQSKGDLVLERVAVGNHLLLGGDNMDLTLAVTIQQRLKKDKGTKLDSWQMQVLTHGCRSAKEQLLQLEADDEWPITIPGRGSSLIGSSIKCDLKRQEVEEALVNGFFPLCKPSEISMKSKRSGLTELGLAFEADPAITHHLARFLHLHKDAANNPNSANTAEEKAQDSKATFFHPTCVLFNGGVLKAPLIRKRLTEVLNSWLKDEGAEPVKILEGTDHDLAVARGAARYGLVKHGQGIRIKGGTNRAYYIGIETSRPAIPGIEPPIKALCVAPLGMEEGTEGDVPGRSFGLVVGEPVEFRFLGSTLRSKDLAGDMVEDWEDEVEELSSIGTTLPESDGKKDTVTPVKLQSRITEVGTLELWCLEQNGPNRWKLEFDVRDKQ